MTQRSGRMESEAPCFDVAVIGGGASGLAAAIAAARAGARVAVLERDVACGLPILSTGNGRCNLSNVHLDAQHYHDPDAARAVMGPAPEAAVTGFFDSLGLLACEIEGRLYPATRRAESVRDVLLRGVARAGVELSCGCEVTGADYDGSAWGLRVLRPGRAVRFEGDLRRARKALAAAHRVEETVRARRVVLATGGSSAPAFDLFGLPHVVEAPVLCPIACAPAQVSLRGLDGLRVEADVSLVRSGETVYREAGEVLFRSYGISGIVAFDISRRVASGDTLELDLFPQLTSGELMGLLRAREDAVGTFDGRDPAWLDGLLARPVSRLLLEMDAAACAGVSDGLRGDVLTRLAKLAKRLPLVVRGRTEERQAQVRRGGVPLDAVDLETLAVDSGVVPAVHVCGEMLDQDADCGGFNLAWAWLSGLRAGRAAAAAAINAARPNE